MTLGRAIRFGLLAAALVAAWMLADERGRAVMIYFEYCGADLPPPGKF